MIGLMPVLKVRKLGLAKHHVAGCRSHWEWQRRCLSSGPFNAKAPVIPSEPTACLAAPVGQGQAIGTSFLSSAITVYMLTRVIWQISVV